MLQLRDKSALLPLLPSGLKAALERDDFPILASTCRLIGDGGDVCRNVSKGGDLLGEVTVEDELESLGVQLVEEDASPMRSGGGGVGDGSVAKHEDPWEDLVPPAVEEGAVGYLLEKLRERLAVVQRALPREVEDDDAVLSEQSAVVHCLLDLLQNVLFISVLVHEGAEDLDKDVNEVTLAELAEIIVDVDRLLGEWLQILDAGVGLLLERASGIPGEERRAVVLELLQHQK
mmetsp:Transcript_55757/g.92242  ORF Transcript_55757/g.92242 Transcript_55757/m.92242 type:complete len:232 (+) Transcript_55757:522-1217(+)